MKLFGLTELEKSGRHTTLPGPPSLQSIGILLKNPVQKCTNLVEVQTIYIIGEYTIRGIQIRAGAIYIYIYGRTCAIIVVHATRYILWVELSHSNFCMGKCNVSGFMRRPF